METELDEGLLLVHVELPEDLGRVEQVLVLEDPAQVLLVYMFARRFKAASANALESFAENETYFFAFQATRGRLRISGTQ